MKKIQKVNIDDLASICSHFRLNRSPQQKQTLFSNFAFMHGQVKVKKNLFYSSLLTSQKSLSSCKNQ